MRKKIVLSRAQAQKKESQDFKARVLALFYGPEKKTQAEIAREMRVSRSRINIIVHERDKKNNSNHDKSPCE